MKKLFSLLALALAIIVMVTGCGSSAGNAGDSAKKGGTIGLSMASRAKKLIGAEIIPSAVENARKNAAHNHVTNAEFLCGDAKDAARILYERGERPDVIVIDPPRKGCDEECLNTILKMRPKRLVYVSCDSATLARDLKYLCSQGYELKCGRAFDNFPMGGHVECVIMMQYCGKEKKK